MTGGRAKRHPATMACGNAVENLIQSGLIRLSDQTASKVFLQGLMRACGPLPQDAVGVFRNILDLHTWHGAILAPIAPKCNQFSMPRVCTGPGKGQ
jgi:hypothetical protein